jgi:hypothetical protein
MHAIAGASSLGRSFASGHRRPAGIARAHEIQTDLGRKKIELPRGRLACAEAAGMTSSSEMIWSDDISDETLLAACQDAGEKMRCACFN